MINSLFLCIQDLDHNVPTQQRVRAMKELHDIVSTKRLEEVKFNYPYTIIYTSSRERVICEVHEAGDVTDVPEFPSSSDFSPLFLTHPPCIRIDSV